MTERTLHLIRHAKADERGPRYPDDSQRPLVKGGHKQADSLARALKKLDISFNRLFASPYTRAVETATPLEARLRRGRLQTLPTLATDDYPALLEAVLEILTEEDSIIAFVGHEPYVSELASLLLTGEHDELELSVKKAAWLELRGPLECGRMELRCLVPYTVYRHI